LVGEVVQPGVAGRPIEGVVEGAVDRDELRRDFSARDATQLGRLLDRLAANAEADRG
jgi:hypothetical protein